MKFLLCLLLSIPALSLACPSNEFIDHKSINYNNLDSDQWKIDISIDGDSEAWTNYSIKTKRNWQKRGLKSLKLLSRIVGNGSSQLSCEDSKPENIIFEVNSNNHDLNQNNIPGIMGGQLINWDGGCRAYKVCFEDQYGKNEVAGFIKTRGN